MAKREAKGNEATISDLLIEERRFEVPEEFRKKANIKDEGIYEKAAADAEKFWAGFAEERHWFKKGDKILDWKPPPARWFVGGKAECQL